jgi:hypothetical protein
MSPLEHEPARAEGEVMNKTAREWLLRVADVVEQWPARSRDNVAVVISVSTPNGGYENHRMHNARRGS